jgi:hypothetical protein
MEELRYDLGFGVRFPLPENEEIMRALGRKRYDDPERIKIKIAYGIEIPEEAKVEPRVQRFVREKSSLLKKATPPDS